MAWKKTETTGTKHSDSCTMSFGRKSLPGICARCDELRDGAKPRAWAISNDKQRCAEIKSHFESEYHRSGKCGVVCTFGEW